jgi:hypothetical protein
MVTAISVEATITRRSAFGFARNHAAILRTSPRNEFMKPSTPVTGTDADEIRLLGYLNASGSLGLRCPHALPAARVSGSQELRAAEVQSLETGPLPATAASRRPSNVQGTRGPAIRSPR